MKISSRYVDQLIKKYNIDTNIVSKDIIIYALNVELEHGRKFGVITNITNDNLDLTFRIVLAHITEFPNYYTYLKQMESKLDKYWSNKTKKSIYKK